MRNNPSMIKPVAILCVIYLMLAGNVSLCAELLQKDLHRYAEPAVLCWQHIEVECFSDVSGEHAASNFRTEVGWECENFMTLHTWTLRKFDHKLHCLKIPTLTVTGFLLTVNNWQCALT